MTCRPKNLRRLFGGVAGFCLGFSVPAALVVIHQVDAGDATSESEWIHAAPESSERDIFSDSDLDGFLDSHELVLGSDPTNADSDGDGYSDLLEYVLETLPNSRHSIPHTAASYSRTGVYKSSAQTVNLAFYFYEPSGASQPQSDRWGLYYCQSWQDATGVLSQVRYRKHHPELGSGAPPCAGVYEFGYEVPISLLQSPRSDFVGWHLYFSMSWGQTVQHGFFNLRKVANQLVEIFIPQTGGNGGPGTPSFATFRPLDIPSAISQNWQAGRMCCLMLSQFPFYQMGTGLSWYPVEGATCEPAPNTFCAPGCTSVNWSPSVNQDHIVRLLDPYALAGL